MAAGTRAQALRVPAAEAGKAKEGTQHHRDRVQRMAQEQDEFLDEGDLDEHEADADRKEIETDTPCARAAIGCRARAGKHAGAPP